MSDAILTSSPLIAAIVITILVSVHRIRQLAQRQQDEKEAQLRLLYTSIARATDDDDAPR